jgi:hypothetical protein
MSKKIFLWSIPRSVSTAFERSIRELLGVKVVYEPHQEAFYFGPERAGEWFLEKEPFRYNPAATYDSVKRRLSLMVPCDGYDAIFVKELVYLLDGRHKDFIKDPIMKNFKHTFLIRDPRKSVTSFHKALEKTTCLSHLSDESVGYKFLHELYTAVQKVDPNPLVIDTDDLLENPKEMMQVYCTETGLPFSKDMVNWSPGCVPEWAECPDHDIWHGAVANSTGLMQKPKSSPPSLSEYSADVKQVVSLSMPFYEAMYKCRLTI